MEIRYTVLSPEERSPDVPDDTKRVPLLCRIRGWALTEAEVGETVEIQTAAGRRVEGILSGTDAGFYHTFGPGVKELSGVGNDLRNKLREGK